MKFFIGLLFTFTFVFANSATESIQQQYLNSYNYEQVGKYSEAIKTLAPLYEQYPKTYALNLRFGWLFYLKKKYSNACRYYKKASLLKPYSIEPRLGLARVYIATASYKKAQAIAYEILKKDYYNYYGNFYAVAALIGEKKYAIAQKIVFKMLTLYPTNTLFLTQLAKIYKKIDSPHLKKLYQYILTLDPNNVFVKSQGNNHSSGIM